MIKLILVRHGNTFEKNETSRMVGSKTDMPLTEFGKKQAEAVADRLIQENLIPTIAFHGPLKRQKETAGIICKRLFLNNVIEAGELAEIDYGEWENLTNDELKFMWPQEFKSWSESGQWPNGIFKQELPEIENNLQKWLLKINADFAGQTVLAVSSNGILRVMNMIFLASKFNFSKSKVSTGSYCVINLCADNEKINASILKWNASC